MKRQNNTGDRAWKLLVTLSLLLLVAYGLYWLGGKNAPVKTYSTQHSLIFNSKVLGDSAGSWYGDSLRRKNIVFSLKRYGSSLIATVYLKSDVEVLTGTDSINRYSARHYALEELFQEIFDSTGDNTYFINNDIHEAVLYRGGVYIAKYVDLNELIRDLEKYGRSKTASRLREKYNTGKIN